MEVVVRAVLCGGPLDRREMDVPEITESANIPGPVSRVPVFARYVRVGDGVDGGGRFLRFDFVGVFEGAGT
jgi:hypothetical protein